MDNNMVNITIAQSDLELINMALRYRAMVPEAPDNLKLRYMQMHKRINGLCIYAGCDYYHEADIRKTIEELMRKKDKE